MTDPASALTQLDLFAPTPRETRPVPTAPLRSVPVSPTLEPERYPVLLMRHGDDGRTWRGAGVWAHVRVGVIDPSSPSNNGSWYSWYPSKGAAERAALEAHYGPVTAKLPSVQISDPGLFVWNRARGWALAYAGYIIECADNGYSYLYVHDEDTAALLRSTWMLDRVQAGTWEGMAYFTESLVDELLTRRGIDPMVLTD